MAIFCNLEARYDQGKRTQMTEVVDQLFKKGSFACFFTLDNHSCENGGARKCTSDFTLEWVAQFDLVVRVCIEVMYFGQLIYITDENSLVSLRHEEAAISLVSAGEHMNNLHTQHFYHFDTPHIWWRNIVILFKEHRITNA